MVENNSICLYEQIVDFRNGKPLMDNSAIEAKMRSMGLDVIKNSTQNIISNDSKYDRIKRVYELMKSRKDDSKAFFSKFDIANPYKLILVYGRLSIILQDALKENTVNSWLSDNFRLNFTWKFTLIYTQTIRDHTSLAVHSRECST
jgi:hypothetical protein